jgi:RND family efflux transporter MFP subunit
MKKLSISLLATFALCGLSACDEKETPPPPAASAPVKPALTVNTTTPQTFDWPQTLAANGNITAWQEAIIGAELGGYRIIEVLVNVADRVKKGQLLAKIAGETVSNELTESRAAVAEAESVLAETRANRDRALQLREKGYYSPQQTTQSQTATDTAMARLSTAKARLQSAELRRANANVTAPDDGVISARIATVGSMTEQGKELFRLIRGGRLEWRAEVTSNEMFRLKIGQAATLTAGDGQKITGIIRAVAPTVDPQTRNGLVYIDLPAEALEHFSAGMFAKGEFQLEQSPALTLPQTAVQLREGFAYVFKIETAKDGTTKVAQTKVTIGRRNGELIEVIGLEPTATVVASGVGFLADGDSVRVEAPVAPVAFTPPAAETPTAAPAPAKAQ